MLRRREEERLGSGANALWGGARGGGGGEGAGGGRKMKLNDELERVRMAARVRAFMCVPPTSLPFFFANSLSRPQPLLAV